MKSIFKKTGIVIKTRTRVVQTLVHVTIETETGSDDGNYFQSIELPIREQEIGVDWQIWT